MIWSVKNIFSSNQQKNENKAWNKFKKNRSAVFSAILLAVITLLVIFSNYILPDNSPQTDLQIKEIGVHDPGFSVKVLVINESKSTSSNALKLLLFGKENKDKLIPLNGFKIRNDSLIAEKYNLDGKGETLIIPNFKGDSNDKGKIQERQYILGSDTFGRDVFSRMVAGGKISLGVGFLAVLISLFIGVFLGALAGFYRGKTDAIIMWLLSVFWSLPSVLLAIALSLGLGKGIVSLILAIGLSMWTEPARLVRGQFISLKERQFVEACKALGFRNFRIIFKHILPNTLGGILVMTVSNFATAILLEAGLSFLGQGVQPPTPSWGGMIDENKHFLFTEHYLIALLPGLAIMVSVLVFTILGNGIRDAFDVKKL